MRIEAIKEQREHFLVLLLLADPSVEIVQEYLERGELFVLFEQDEACGVLHLDPHDDRLIEIKNVAVKENMQGRGYGKMLVRHAIAYCKEAGYTTLLVGTGNSSLDNLAFYQKLGFRFKTVERDFFVKHYPEPFFEEGIQCRDMIYLDMELT